MYAWERAPLREIFDFQQIYSVLIGCKKVQKRRKLKTKVANVEFTYQFTRVHVIRYAFDL